MWTGRWRYSDNTLDNVVKGEGVFISCAPGFEAGKYYTLKLHIGNSSKSIDHVYINLINSADIGGSWYPDPSQLYDVHNAGYNIPGIPTNNYQIEDLYLSPNTSMTLHEYSFIPNSNYDALWIHPVASSSIYDPIAVLWVDNVIIDPCIDNITYSNTSSLPSITRRANYIATSGSVTVTSSQDVTFMAGNYIDLKPDFTAQYGCNFKASIHGCGVIGDCAAGNTKKKLNTVADIPQNIAEENDFKFFPNPVIDKSYFHYNSHENAILYIYSSMGRLIGNYELPVSKNSFCISSSDYDAGLYMYKIIIKNQNFLNGKFVIIK